MGGSGQGSLCSAILPLATEARDVQQRCCAQTQWGIRFIMITGDEHEKIYNDRLVGDQTAAAIQPTSYLHKKNKQQVPVSRAEDDNDDTKSGLLCKHAVASA